MSEGLDEERILLARQGLSLTKRLDVTAEGSLREELLAIYVLIKLEIWWDVKYVVLDGTRSGTSLEEAR